MVANPKQAQTLEENPLFERIPCPICFNKNLQSFFEISYGKLKQKKSLDYEVLGITAETLLTVDRCPNCTFVFANPRIKAEHESLIYNESKKNMYRNQRFKLGTQENRLLLLKTRASHVGTVLKLMNMKPAAAGGLTLLDVGAGLGHTLSIARTLGVEPYGVEIDQQRISICQEQGLNVFSPAQFDQVYPQLRFDFIVMQSVIEHVIDLRQVMSSVAARSKEGTVLYVNGVTPHLIKLEQRQGRFVKAHFIEHVNYFTSASLEQLMLQFGFVPAKRDSLLIEGRTVSLPRFARRIYKNVFLRNGHFSEFFIFKRTA